MAEIDKEQETIEQGADQTRSVASFARGIIVVVAALVLFSAFFVGFWLFEKQSTANRKAHIVVMGDSLFANTIDDTSVAAILSRKLNTEIVDVSFGGSCMSYIDRDARLDNETDAYCMAALTQAVIAEDFRYQENANTRLNATEYFDERIELLETIDFSKVDILIIDYLLNDYQIAVPVESGSNELDEYTFEGAYRSVLKQLKAEFPELRIIVVAPVKTWYLEEHIPSTEMDIGGGTIDIYIETQKRICEEMGVEWISLFELYDEAVQSNPELIIDSSGEKLEMYQAFTYDNIHPNEIARELIAEYLCEYLADGE